jgi:methionine synthase I (cobalamin-dependent)/5,10-methylenetetrahydrofolate reductase
MSNLTELLQNELILGDGAIGTLLYQRGQPLNASYEALNITYPEVVRQLHLDYANAGSKLIETNTFAANRVRLEKYGLADRVREINARGAELAKDVAREHSALVAGSVGPLTTNPSVLLTNEQKISFYTEQCAALLEGGVDALFFETFPNLGELLLATAAGKQLGATIIASLSFADDGHTSDGVRIAPAFERLRDGGADVVGLNCHFGPTIAEKLLQEITVKPGTLISAYPNAGRPQFYEGRYLYHPTPQYFVDFLPRLVAQGVRLIGGCCGTTPETIAAMARVLPQFKPIESKRGLPVIEVVGRVPETAPPETSLLEIIRKQTLIVTELDPPKSLDLEKLIQGTKALKEAGTDFVTLADNSLAILRVSNLAASFLVKERTGMEPVVHMACRDHNLLGLQSQLMGLHALGLRHVLALTGDPAKIGDHPDASSVYDVNSLGLIQTIQRMNEGFAANGRDLKAKTQFIIGCALNPNAKNLDSQIRKLESKIKAGAHFVMTQPIFDPLLAKITYEKTSHLGVPILVGVMPLMNGRNTEFLHNEVPGIVIPDRIRDRMRGKEGPDGNAAGLAIARELCDKVLEFFPGIYLITPLLRYDLTVELSRYVRQLVPRSKPLQPAV